MELQQFDVEICQFQSIEKIKINKTWSIINTFCCCICFGGIAWFYLNEMEKFVLLRQTQDAMYTSEKAQSINIVATIAGIFIFTICWINFIIAQR